MSIRRRMLAALGRRSVGRGNPGPYGGAGYVAAHQMLALSDFSAANYFATQNPGGEAGIASGWGATLLCQFDRIATVYRAITRRYNGVAGYAIDITAGGAFTFVAVDGSATARVVNTTLAASDARKVQLLTCLYDGTNLRIYRARDLVATLAMTGYTPLALAQSLGASNAAGEPFLDGSILALLMFRGTPSAANITALADTTRILGDLPDTMQGATVTHHWSLKRALAGQYVTNGQAAPASLRDNLTGAPADLMSKQGSPTVRVIDPSIDGRKTYGAQGFSAANLLQTANPGGIAGSVGGLHVMARARCDALGTQVVISRSHASNAGWRLSVSGGNWVATFTPTAGAQVNATQSAVQVGKMVHVTLVHTGAGNTVQLWIDGVQVGSDVACVGFTPFAGRTLIGALNDLTFPASTTSVFQVCGGNAVPTAAEILQSAQESERTGTLVPIAGKSTVSWDLSADIVANGGPSNGVPATTLDRIGTDHLTTVGTGLTVAQRVERTWGYETSPVFRGVGGFAAPNYLQTAPGAGVVGAATGFWFAAPFRVLSQSVASAFRLIVSNRPGGTQGYWLGTTGTNSVIQAYVVNGAGAEVGTPASAILAADVGKMMLAIVQHTGPGANIRLYVKRAEAGGGIGIAGYTPPVGQRMRISGPTFVADGVASYGSMGGLGVLTTAEIMAAFDAFMVNEELTAIPGKTDFLVPTTKLIRDNGGLLPAQFNDQIGTSHMSVVGAPTVDDFYARAFNF